MVDNSFEKYHVVSFLDTMQVSNHSIIPFCTKFYMATVIVVLPLNFSSSL